MRFGRCYLHQEKDIEAHHSGYVISTQSLLNYIGSKSLNLSYYPSLSCNAQ